MFSASRFKISRLFPCLLVTSRDISPQEDVDAFMAQPGNESADAALRKLDERYQKYKFMELSLAQRKRR